MNQKANASAPRKRATALIVTGALLALGGAVGTASAASAVSQTIVPANNYTSTAPATQTPAERAVITAVTTLTDANSKTVQIPQWSIVGTSTQDKVWAVADPNNTANAVTPYGLFFYVPSTHDLVDVSSNLSNIASTSTSFIVPKAAYDATKATAYLETLPYGTEYDVIVGQTPFQSGGAVGDRSVLTGSEKYYLVKYQYNGLNTTSGVYESGPVGSTPNQPPAAAGTETVLTATADSAGIHLSAKVQDPTTHAVDTTATGGMTFKATGLSDVPATVSGGIAIATIPNTTAGYNATYSFTAVYSGNSSFATSTSAPQSVTTVAPPANFGTADFQETVVVPAAGAGALTLSVPLNAAIDFGTATPDLVTGKFTATAPMPEATVTDTRFTKGDWTLNGVNTDLSDGASHTIPASSISWAGPVVNSTPSPAGVTAGTAASSLATPQTLAKFHDAGVLGQIVTKVDTNLSLTAPINQAQGTYHGKLTITLL